MLPYSRWFGLPLLLLTLAAITPRVQGDEGKVLLRYQFTPGQVVRYRVAMRDDYNVQVNDEQYHPYSDQTSTKSYRVVSVKDDGSAVLELTFEATKIEIQQNGETFHFDSEQSGAVPPMFNGLAEMVGKPYAQMTVSNTGEVTHFKSLVTEDASEIGEAKQAAMDVLLRLPEEPIEVGERWREDFQGSITLTDSLLKKPVRMQRRFHFKSLTDGKAEIEVQTVVLTSITEPQEQLQLIRRQPRGTLLIDTSAGLLIRRSFSQDNQVVNFQQGASSMRFTQKHEETFENVVTASNDAAIKK